MEGSKKHFCDRSKVNRLNVYFIPSPQCDGTKKSLSLRSGISAFVVRRDMGELASFLFLKVFSGFFWACIIPWACVVVFSIALYEWLFLNAPQIGHSDRGQWNNGHQTLWLHLVDQRQLAVRTQNSSKPHHKVGSHRPVFSHSWEVGDG